MFQAITADYFTAMRPQFRTAPAAQGEVHCSFEHFSQHGTMIDYYILTPTPDLLAQPEVQALEGGLDTITFLEQRDGPWLVHLHGVEMNKTGGNIWELPMERAEMERLLANCGVTLPVG